MVMMFVIVDICFYVLDVANCRVLIAPDPACSCDGEVPYTPLPSTLNPQPTSQSYPIFEIPSRLHTSIVDTAPQKNILHLVTAAALLKLLACNLLSIS